MRIAFIGDIIGRPGRSIIKEKLKKFRDEYGIDCVVANAENASHGFGLTIKNAKELLDSGINLITGGNHSWDKKEIIGVMDEMPILRPINYPDGVPGRGLEVVEVGGEKLAVINLMGHYSMPMVENPFLKAINQVKVLKEQGIENIFIDFHAETTSEKRALLTMLRGEVSGIAGTHTHVGCDDLVVDHGTFYVTDVGLTGCRDGVIGMDSAAPHKRFLTGMPASFDIPKSCKKILQFVVMDFKEGECTRGFKISAYDDRDEVRVLEAFYE
jgi:metallophosphoesterase (TIGR00282 family)